MKPLAWPLQRAIEAVIIAVIAGLGSSFITVRVLDERVSSLASRVTALDEREARHHESLQESLRQIYSLLVRIRQP